MLTIKVVQSVAHRKLSFQIHESDRADKKEQEIDRDRVGRMDGETNQSIEDIRMSTNDKTRRINSNRRLDSTTIGNMFSSKVNRHAYIRHKHVYNILYLGAAFVLMPNIFNAISCLFLQEN